MSIDAVSGIQNPIGTLTNSTKSASEGFQGILKDAVDNYVQNAQVDNKDTQDLLTGDVNDLHTSMIDMEKAGLSLQFMMQVRNKVLEAYNEVMRMQV